MFDLSTMELIAEKWHLNDGGIEDKHITVDGPVGASYAAGDIFKLDVIKTNADGTTSSAMANSDIGYIQADNVDGGKIYSMNVYPTGALTAGRNYSETPTVVEHDVSGSGIGNTSVTISGETNRLGGNARFRYVTKPVKLKQQASDIAVFMDAHKPRNTEVHVYYKVRHRDDPELLDDKNWIKMKQTSPTDGLHSVTKSAWTVGQSVPMTEHRFSTGSQNDMIQYESSTFGHLVKFDGFKYFAIKIVGFADNHATPPTVASLRAIAVT